MLPACRFLKAVHEKVHGLGASVHGRGIALSQARANSRGKAKALIFGMPGLSQNPEMFGIARESDTVGKGSVSNTGLPDRSGQRTGCVPPVAHFFQPSVVIQMRDASSYNLWDTFIAGKSAIQGDHLRA